jgi:hypothetical protein
MHPMKDTASQVRCWDCGAACPEWQATRRLVVTGYSSGWGGRLFYNRVTLCSWCSTRRQRRENRARVWKLARRTLLVVVVISLFNQCRAEFDGFARTPTVPASEFPTDPTDPGGLR